MAEERWLQAASAAAVAMPAPQRQGGEWAEAMRTRFREAEAAMAEAAAMPGTPRWAGAREAAMPWSCQEASAARGEVVAAMRLSRYREAATVAGKSRPCPVGSVATVAGWEVAAPLRAVRFPCHCSR